MTRTFKTFMLLCLLPLGVIGGAGAQVATSPVTDQTIAVNLLQKQRQGIANGSPITSPPVATGCSDNYAGISNGTDTAANFQTRHYALYNTTGFRVVFGNAVPGSAPLTNIVVKATLWLHGGTSNPTMAYPLTFGGATSVTLPPGKQAVSDVMYVPIAYKVAGQTNAGYLAAGDFFYVREYVTAPVATDGKYYWPLVIVGSGGQSAGSSHSASEVDETNYTSVQLNALTPSYTGSLMTGQWQIGQRPPDTDTAVYAPLAILGIPRAGDAYPVTLGIYGDSIANGTGDNYEPNAIIAGASGGNLTGNAKNFASTYGTNSGAGYWVRTEETLKQPIVNTAVYGDLFYLSASDDALRAPVFSGCAYIVSEMGINRIISYSDGTADANVAANVTDFFTGSLTSFIPSVKRWGCKVILETYPPADTTASGNVPRSCEHTRVAINNYLRANWQTMGAVGLLDKTLAVEADQQTQLVPITLSTGLSGIGIYSSTAPQQPLTTSGGAWLKVSGTAATIDGTHPSATGHAALSAYIVTNLPPLLTK